MKKNGIVLLITLFFIFSISIIILKNLDDSQNFIEEVNLDHSLSQLKLTNENLKDEIINLTFNYKENIDELLEVTTFGIPFSYGDLNLTIKLEEYFPSNCYLNDINSSEQLNNNCDRVVVENILYQYDFIEILNQLKPISNQAQLKYFLDTYYYKTKDEQILTIGNNFDFIKIDTNSSKRYLDCNYELNTYSLNSSCNFIYELNSKELLSFNFVLK
ncbi:MAG: hypothetical protein U9Q20_04850 [Campylobacterota bacterium]|nr:hypothetical protein [Campylobacterota bacterium]